MGIIAYIFGGIGLFLLLDGALLHLGIAALVYGFSCGRHGYAYSAGVVLRHKGAGAG